MMHRQPIVKVAATDVPGINRIGGEVRILLSPKTVDATEGFMGTVRLEPGEFLAEQYNPYSDKFCYLVRGEVVIRVDGAEVKLAPDEALMVRRGQRHRIVNAGGETALIVFQISPLAPRPELGHVDTEEVPHPESPVPQVGGVRDGWQRPTGGTS
ncbi:MULTISPECIES: cupin domain-containing protein [Micromonospora]|uniref:cupin domain-containing protein n=1 Tax=Micromonospora TaxID=1873 RepID=UPI001EE87973|nr:MULTISPECIES: cupin domain-containing protein [Micromonospora]MCG5449079.1 cupin domain-containing protein [Micromonospora hortensis]MCX5118984.1 cupin domain-containing protein [Micromonospora sp. NBC_00362]WTI11223.1 cupin domain-containing protein [Micromonospora sp. NBC_00821]